MKDKEMSMPPRSNLSILMMVMGVLLALGISTTFTTAWRLNLELSLADLIAFLLSLVSILLVVLGVYGVVQRRINQTILDTIIFSLMLTAVFWSAGLLLIKNDGWLSLLILGLAALYFLACSWFLFNHASWQKTLLIAILIATLPNGLLLVFYGKRDLNQDASIYKALAPDVTDIKFEKTPDVYLIGFLGASPDKVLQKSLGLEGSGLSRAMERLEFRSFDAVFAEAVTTRKSYDLLLGMTREYVAQFPEPTRGRQFSGNVYSPLFDIFRSNGYSITTLTDDHKFGYNKGPYIDQYLVNNQISLCKRKDHVKTAIRSFVFFGGCNIRLSRIFPSLSMAEGPPAKLLIKTIGSSQLDEKPRLLMAHLKPPLHAPQQTKFQANPNLLEGFVKRYKKADNEAAGHLEEIMRAINSRKRDSIVFVFGDRGVGLIHKIDASPDFNYMIEDRFSVIAGLYPANQCTEHFAVQPATTSAIIRKLITCLSTHDAWPTDYEHRIIYEGKLLDPKRIQDEQ